MNELGRYLRVFLTFARNSLVRDMTFRTNFLLQCVSSLGWTAMNVGFYLIIFEHTGSIGEGTGWDRDRFFLFIATTWFINSLVQAFFMPNAQEFSEMIRTGGLDFALLKPIDTQFLISFRRIDWSQLSNFFAGGLIAVVSLWNLGTRDVDPMIPSPLSVVLYVIFVVCGVMMMYSLMVALSATSVWLGRNQSLYNFWFYITNFSRYPMEIYNRSWGRPLYGFFTFVIPILLVVNVPARILAQPVSDQQGGHWFVIWAAVATVLSVTASRWMFRRSLLSYRSASS
ncbi:ABC transporter permease [Roseiconus lacunae]|uniref:ABC-2 family transporter protein n=1 Tax=Roseiconus lacunae TaxID=2605694 RepID=A0ABT7PJ24_9BACT|nr:ABC-2 family transporter protein [Roseiconus lacunae]MCD0458381.1 ABC-2 family transporter protein [Roseiconus lacunae]MDM4016271.1 ABC-2 family transporter protein [Roseiconus lacunae]WRQ52126.1 ABC-2 family transporter protein [Stieleria sp. HD01]